MKTKFLFISLLFFTTAYSQIDESRLGFTNESLVSQQVAQSVSPNGKLIAFAYKDLTVKIFDITANKFIKILKSPLTDIFDIVLTSTNKLIVCSKNEVIILDVKSGQKVESFPLDDDMTRVVYSHKSNLVAFAKKNGATTIIDLNTGKEKITIVTSNKGSVGAIAIRPNGKEIAITTFPGFGKVDNRRVDIFDINTGNLLRRSEFGGWYFMADYDSTGQKLLVGGNMPGNQYRFVSVLNAETLKEENFLKFRVIIGNLNEAGNYLSGIPIKDKVLVTTQTNAFNVIDFPTSMRTFSTLSDSKVFGEGGEKKSIASSVNQISHLGNGKFLVNFFFNNVSQIYDVNLNQIVAYIFSDSNEDFAVISKDGRIDGTPGGLSKVFWTSRKSEKRTPVESTFEKNFTPKLLFGIISQGSQNQEEFNVDNVMAKVPSLQISSINGDKPTTQVYETKLKSTQIDIVVKENPSEVAEIKLFHNAKFFKSIPNNGSERYSFNVSLNNSFGETNYFYCQASSKSGVDSEKIKLIVNYKSSSTERPRLFLITVGINEYKNSKYKLNYAVADANGVDQSFSQLSSQLFQEVVTYTIRDDKAVKSNITNALEEVRNKSLEQDVLIFYYAGHGVIAEHSGKEEYYIVPQDVIQLYGQPEVLEEKAISAETLKLFAQSVNAQKQLFIIDACQSSGAIESMANRGVAEERALAQLARSTGTFWVAATGSNQYATEFEKLGHGLFTYILLNGIKGEADADKDGKLTVRELSTYIENKVPELSEQLKGSAQYPSSYSYGNDFPIVTYK